jgi:hypothetical protein
LFIDKATKLLSCFFLQVNISGYILRNLTLKEVSFYSRARMRRRLLLCGLIAAMLMSVAGVGAQQRQGSCPLTNLPDCCKKAQAAGNTPQVSLARLCCNLNCSEPGNTGSSASSVFPTPQNLPAQTFVLPHSWLYPRSASSRSQGARPFALNPKYIQHLALLI